MNSITNIADKITVRLEDYDNHYLKVESGIDLEKELLEKILPKSLPQNYETIISPIIICNDTVLEVIEDMNLHEESFILYCDKIDKQNVINNSNFSISNMKCNKIIIEIHLDLSKEDTDISV